MSLFLYSETGATNSAYSCSRKPTRLTVGVAPVLILIVPCKYTFSTHCFKPPQSHLMLVKFKESDFSINGSSELCMLPPKWVTKNKSLKEELLEDKGCQPFSSARLALLQPVRVTSITYHKPSWFNKISLQFRWLGLHPGKLPRCEAMDTKAAENHPDRIWAPGKKEMPPPSACLWWPGNK